MSPPMRSAILGLRHNHRASQAYSIQQLRDPAFTAKHGSVASIMSYGRYNYVAQPEDKVERLFPMVAPYDYFAISWGYKPIPKAKTAEEEAATLDEWAARQLNEPFLALGGEDGPSSVDPTVLTENIGDDPVQATALGLKNLDRVLDHLIVATTTKGEDYSLLEEAYQAILTHRRNWFGAVAKQVGGVVENRRAGRPWRRDFCPRPEGEAEGGGDLPLAERIDHAGETAQPRRAQPDPLQWRGRRYCRTTESSSARFARAGRLSRLLDAEVLAPDKAYTAMELVADLQAGVWCGT